MKISTILDQVEYQQIALPEFQRGYVWTRDQVRGLFTSLYRRYPVGSLLMWTTEVEEGLARGEGAPAAGSVVKLLLDGQQRITSLYGVIKGRPPAFFQGNERAFTDLWFNVETETFEFYGPIRMRGEPLWISVTEAFNTEVADIVTRLSASTNDMAKLLEYGTRINRLVGIRDLLLHPEEITGRDRTIDEVVEIFNKVNSGGTKLSAGDLALARICADRPEARTELRRMLQDWDEAGYQFALEWLLRCVNSVATGQAKYVALRSISSDEFGTALKQTEVAVNFLLNLIADRLGIDHDRVLAGRYSFSALVRLVTERGGAITDPHEQQKVLYWYIHSFLWGRYSGSTESVLQRDLDALSTGGVDGMITELRRWRGTLEVRPEDFETHSLGSRFYPMLYLLTRVNAAQDLGTGIGINAALLGRRSQLHVHHIFPKRRLYDAHHTRSDVNAVANMCFLTASSNQTISDREPREYLREVAAERPGALASQWIPSDPSMWEIGAYSAFLATRREALAAAANSLLDALVAGTAGGGSTSSGDAPPTSVEVEETEDAQPELSEIARIARERGLSDPAISFEVNDDESGELLVLADLAWPEGAQPGLSEPVALLLEPDPDMEARLSLLGYRFFTTRESLIWYLETLVGADIDGDATIGDPLIAGES